MLLREKGGRIMTSVQRENMRPTLFQEIMYLLIKIGFVLLVFALVLTFIFGAMRYNADNMNPAIYEGDLLLFYRLDHNYAQKDVVVLRHQHVLQVQRIVAVAGDEVNITKEGLMVNGSYQQEDHIYYKTKRYVSKVKFPIRLGENQVFVLSDQRTQATDSRIYGPVSTKEILGKVICDIRRRNI